MCELRTLRADLFGIAQSEAQICSHSRSHLFRCFVLLPHIWYIVALLSRPVERCGASLSKRISNRSNRLTIHSSLLLVTFLKIHLVLLLRCGGHYFRTSTYHQQALLCRFLLPELLRNSPLARRRLRLFLSHRPHSLLHQEVDG